MITEEEARANYTAATAAMLAAGAADRAARAHFGDLPAQTAARHVLFAAVDARAAARAVLEEMGLTVEPKTRATNPGEDEPRAGGDPATDARS